MWFAGLTGNQCSLVGVRACVCVCSSVVLPGVQPLMDL